MLQQIHLLLHMTALQPRRYAGTRIPPRIKHMPAIMMFRLIQQGLNPRLGKAPPTRIKRFLLAPDDILGIGVHVQVFFELGPGEGVQLLDAGDGDVFVFFGGTVFVQGDVDLAGAEDDTVDVFGLFDSFAVFGVRDDPLEVRVASEVFD